MATPFLSPSPQPRNVETRGSRFYVGEPVAGEPLPFGHETATVVDENEGGIILYTHEANADRIVEALRTFTGEI